MIRGMEEERYARVIKDVENGSSNSREEND